MSQLQNMRRQRGLTLLEALLSLMVMAVVLAGVVRLLDRYSNDVKSSVTAQHMAAVGNAATAYIKDNYAAVAGAATSTVPAVITVAMLTSTGYLPTGFSVANNYQQTVCVLVLEPAANVLNGLVIAQGGQTLDDITLGSIASTVGATGGGVYSTAATTMRGAMGGWASPATDYTRDCTNVAVTQSAAVGHPLMALWFSNGDLASGYLHRDAVPGHTELATMNTPLILNTVQTEGAACTPLGAIARNALGVVLSCQNGLLWKTLSGSSYWKDPVANFASLPGTGDPLGTVRVTTDTARAYMWTGGGWNALAVDQNGNLTVPGTLTAAAGRVVAWNNVPEGGVLQLVDVDGTKMHLQAFNGAFRIVNHPFNASLFHVHQGGNVVAIGSITAYGTMVSNSLVTNTGITINNSGASISNPGRLHINAGENLYLNPWSGGTTVIGGGGGSGNLQVAGQAWASSQYVSGNSDANDYYVRAAGQWASQMGAPRGTVCGMAVGPAADCMGYHPAYGCPPGYTQNYWHVSFGDGNLFFCTKN